MFSWCIALTQPFSEMIAEEAIKAKDLQPFNPKCRVTKIIRNRKRIDEVPYFPGYIFVNVDLDLTDWVRIIHCRGVRDMLWSSPGKPARVRDAMMQVLLAKCSDGIVDAHLVDRAVSKIIPRGATVSVPSLDTTGRVTWTNGDRVTVLMSFLGTRREVKMKASDVELIE